MLRLVLVERETHKHQSGAAAVVAGRVLEQKAVEMRDGRGAIATCYLELRELKERVAGAFGEREFHDHTLVVELCVDAAGRERRTPVQGVGVDGSVRIRCRDDRVDEQSAGGTVAIHH